MDNNLTKEEKKIKIKEYKENKKAQKQLMKAQDAQRLEIEKAKSKEDIKKEKDLSKEEAILKKKKQAEEKKLNKEKKKAFKLHLKTLSKEEKEEFLAKLKKDKKESDYQKFDLFKINHATQVSKKRTELEDRYDFGGRIHLFFFNLGQSKFFQSYIMWWRKFEICHPESAKWAYQVFYFVVFSMGVTIVQYLFYTIMPMALGIGLAGTEFMWPNIPISVGGFEYNWGILGYAVLHDKAGQVVIGGGLGYFISYEVGAFCAQIINFPLQRNITFKSHGNPWYQAFWYFIGWVVISLFCNALNGLWIPLANEFMPPAVYQILQTVVTGGVSMVIFFFIFKIIFPAGEAKKDN